MKKDYHVVDLTFPLEDGMITYPSASHSRFEASVLGRIAIEGRETRKLTIGSHCGTHIDAPRHFYAGEIGVDQLCLNTLIGPAVLVNMGELAPGATIRKSDVEVKIQQYDKVERLIIRTDWSKYWNTDQYYFDWPTLEHDAADFIIDKGIKLLGFDFPSPDPAYGGPDRSCDCPLHKRFFKNKIILVEYLTNLDQLQEGLIWLMAIPLRLKDFDGSPARVSAYPL